MVDFGESVSDEEIMKLVDETVERIEGAGNYGTSHEQYEEGYDEFDAHGSFMMGKTRANSMHAKNMFTSRRLGQSFISDETKDVELAPTLLSHNVAFVTDPNLGENEKGTFYYAERCFYNMKESPEYALTVNEDIYSRVLEEVADSRAVPCGLYFCCHGGDGAHAGISHDDYVDIRLAWTAISTVAFVMAVVSIAYP